MVLVGLLVAAGITAVTPKQYESCARIFVSVDTQAVVELTSAQFYVQSRMESYADLADQRELMSRVVDELDLEDSPETLSDQVSSEVTTATVSMSFCVTDESAVRAQEIAATGSVLFIEYVEELETPRGETRSQVSAAVTDPPIINNTPVSPRVALNLALAGILGLILGIGLAAARELLDNTIKLEHIEELTGAPVMASVPIDRKVAKDPLLTDVDGFSPRGEAFRMLRTNLQYVDIDSQPRSLVVTSAIAGEGKTHTAINLAIALAQAGQRVVIVDGDLRRPRVSQMLGLDRSVGLTTVLVGRTTLEDAIQVHEASGVHVLAGGPTPPNPTEVLQTLATRDVLARLREVYDAVIIDAPPLLPVADAAILGAQADGMILVARYGKTRRDEVGQAAQRLRNVGAKLHGVVINMLPKRAAEGYQYYYYYEESNQPTATPGARKKQT